LEEILVYIAFLLGGIIFSLTSNKILLTFSQSLGIRNKNDVVVRWSNQSKPSLGGVSFYVVFLFSFIIYSFSSNKLFHNQEFFGLLLSGSLAFGMGLADDAYNTKPLAKLFIQILCGVILVFTGTVIDLTHNYQFDSLLTISWVVILMNSLNMLDNMDGITGTVCLFILSTCFTTNLFTKGLNFDINTISIIAVIGSLLGFLYYNINPSKLFMGDAGSQFIGLFVAFATTHNIWNIHDITHGDAPSWIGFAICLVTFTPAASDTLTVVINRIKRGQSPMVGGKDHTTHHLVYAGLKDKQVWYLFTGISFLSSFISFIMIILTLKKIYFPVALLSLFFLAVFIPLYRITIKYKQP
jgi:UDP-GlcNAc:undecaprenyl-phosphate GlcNAc-1-phosphate transferase